MKKVVTSLIIVIVLFFIFLGFLLLPIKSYNFSDQNSNNIFKIKISLIFLTSVSQGNNLMQIGVGKVNGGDVLNFAYHPEEISADCESLYKTRFGDLENSDFGFQEKKVGEKIICIFDLEKDLYKNSTLGYLILPGGRGIVSVLYPDSKKSLAEMMIKTIK